MKVIRRQKGIDKQAVNPYLPGYEYLPDGGFEYRGTIVEVLGQWYVFYHRQTNGSPYSRQGCVEDGGGSIVVLL